MSPAATGAGIDAATAAQRRRRRASASAARSAAAVPLVFGFILVSGRAGGQSLDLAFFTHLPKPVGEPAAAWPTPSSGTLMLIGARGRRSALPVGIIGGVYLAESAIAGSPSGCVRFTADVLNGVPSIVVGIFAYDLVVLPMRRFSALAGGVALGIMMIPIVARTTEELLRAGARAAARGRARRSAHPRGRPSLTRRAAGGRAGHHHRRRCWRWRAIAGETAPLLFTALQQPVLAARASTQPIASLTVQIYTYAISPYEDWHRQAWAGALVLITLRDLAARVSRRGVAT